MATVIPSIPAPAADLDSLTASVAALKAAVEILSGQLTGSDTRRFTEDVSKRVTTTVTLTGVSSVTVKQINKLVMVDLVTGEQWVWER